MLECGLRLMWGVLSIATFQAPEKLSLKQVSFSQISGADLVHQIFWSPGLLSCILAVAPGAFWKWSLGWGGEDWILRDRKESIRKLLDMGWEKWNVNRKPNRAGAFEDAFAAGANCLQTLLKCFRSGARAVCDSLATGIMLVIKGKRTYRIPVPEPGFGKQMLLWTEIDGFFYFWGVLVLR